MKIVTFGEIMLRLGAPDYLRLNQCNSLDVSYAGAEANVAVSLANYGVPVEYITALPDNPITSKCLDELRGKKVNVDHVVLCGERIGILYIETGSIYRPSRIFYDRSHSSITELTPGVINWEKVFEGATWFHWTGITPALSQNTAKVLKEAIDIANSRKLIISCDINYREKLWKYGKEAKEVMPELVSKSDIILGNEEDCEKVFGIYNPQNEKMRVPETKGLKNPQIPKTKRLLFIQTHKRQRKPKQPVSLPFVLYIQFKSNIIFTANQTDSLINVILVNMDITKV